MSKKKVGIIIGVIAAAVVAAGVGFYFLKGRSSGGNSADKVYVEKVSAIMNQSAGVNNRYSGVVEPQETLEINKDSERKVKEVYVSVGDEVEEGTVLFSYDTEELQMQIDQAKLEMAFPIQMHRLQNCRKKKQAHRKTSSLNIPHRFRHCRLPLSSQNTTRKANRQRLTNTRNPSTTQK